jgi:Chaperone of endosialidase
MKTSSLKWFFVGAISVTASLSVLAAVNIPNSFSAGQPIKASDVNANFSSLKAAVDALQAAPLTLPVALEGTNPNTGTALLKVSTTDIGSAIYGISNDPTSAAAGVQGDSSSPGGFGVYGLSRATEGSGTGVYGQGGIGVWGKSINGRAGVFGLNENNANGIGVEGKVTGSNAAGVYGVNPTGPGAWDRSTNGSGVYGESTGGSGGQFKSTNGYALEAVSDFTALTAESKKNTAAIVTTRGTGVSALIINQWGSGNIITGRDASNAEVFRVLNDGSVFSKTNSYTSDRNAKTNFSSVNALGVLEKVAAMPVTRWNYKSDASGIVHIGPMAQDFHAAFGLNGADDTHINTVDAQGVALAAIKGLNQKLETENAALKAQFKALEARLAKLERK